MDLPKKLFPFMALLGFATFLSSCSGNKKQSFEGRLITSCNDPAPVANQQVEMYYLEKSSGAGIGGRSFSYTTTTDAQGRFEFSFEEKEWGTDNVGTFGAQIISEGEILEGIASDDSDLGEILLEYNRNLSLIATISSQGLNPTDSVYIENKFIGVGNFSGIQDTLTADIRNESSGNNRSVPILNETRVAIIQWRIIRASDNDIIGGQTFALAQECQEQLPAEILITP